MILKSTTIDTFYNSARNEHKITAVAFITQSLFFFNTNFQQSVNFSHFLHDQEWFVLFGFLNGKLLVFILIFMGFSGSRISIKTFETGLI